MPSFEPLPQSYFERPTLKVARDLLGAYLVHETPEGTLAGRIVETEAYLSDDPAMHGWRAACNDEGFVLPIGRAADLFAEPGRSYVYLTYFTNWLVNVVTEPEGTAGAVLIRAIEAVEGIEQMRFARPAARRDRDLGSGPAKLAQALGITGKDWHGIDMTKPPLFFAAGDPVPDSEIVRTSRIGVNRGADLPYRFLIKGHPCVSPGVPSNIRLARKAERG
ncbi:DNA-3-methyladenine glycosylase [soil metagenome]